jgi:tetratricopeptide (TPR) repeat protein
MVPAFAVYYYLANRLNFIQDDAYITFRYIANYLNGDGLVFNIGERIEGFTNFGWTIYLLLWGAMGADYIVIAKYSGLIFGALSLVLIFLIGLKVIGSGNTFFAILPVYLVAFNESFAYWSPAGLETAAFTFLVLLSLYLFLKRSRVLAAALALAVWVRPEGALLAILLIVIESIEIRQIPRFALISAMIAFVLSLPFLAFKIFYYGSIFPNPFYAKTGFDLEQLLSGLDYARLFFLHYGFLGVAFIVALLLYRNLSFAMKAVWYFCLLYTGYIVFIGGDVLKVHRFFLPVFGPAAILMAAMLAKLFENFKVQTRHLLLFLFTLPLIGLTYWLAVDHVSHYNKNEISFVEKMKFMADEISRTDSTNFSIAISTIGKIGYELIGHDIIDVLGLTDSTIARHSQADVEGLETTWKERKYNVRYILERAPDYVVFSTGSKPSAPAEKALCLYPSYFMSYNPIPWSRKVTGQTMGVPQIAFKKVRPVNPDLSVRYPLQYVEYMKRGQEYYPAFKYDSAFYCLDSALKVSPRPYNPYLYYEYAFCMGKMNRYKEAEPILDEIVAQDSLFVFAHRDLYLYARIYSDTAKAAIHERWIKKLAPWYWDEIKAVTDIQAARNTGKKRN